MKKGLGCLFNGIVLSGCFYGGWYAHKHFSYPDMKVIYVQVSQSEKTSDRLLSQSLELHASQHALDPDGTFCRGNDNYDYRARLDTGAQKLIKLIIEPIMKLPDS